MERMLVCDIAKFSAVRNNDAMNNKFSFQDMISG